MRHIMKRHGLIFAVVLFSSSTFIGTVFAMDAVLSWSANTESNVTGYKVYFGTGSRSYGTPIDVGKQTSYTVSGLPDRTHYFAVTAYNTSGLESGFSAEVSKTPVAAPDTTAPLISSVNASSITLNSAVITWGTNELSSTQIQYGTTTAYGSSTTLNTTPVTVHSQVLSNLLPGTLYHYRVLSRDAAGNLATSANNTFTTLADTVAPSRPGGVAASVLSATQINLSWNASTDNVGVAGYRVYRNGTQVGTTTAPNYADTGLAANTLYSYTVAAFDAAGNLSAQSAAVSATTLLPPDTTAPVISAISAGSITSSGAAITWTTNEPATTQIQYGTTTAYGLSTPLVSTLLTAHSQSLSNLTAGTLYHYRVLSRDAAGNLATSANNTFTTAALLPPPTSTPTTVRLSPAADTFININTSVYNTSTTLNTYTFPANQVANAVLMKFNLSGLPTGAVIQSATLNLSLVESDATTDATYSIGVHKLINRNPDLTLATGMTYDGTNGWTANSCCRNNVPLAQADISAAYDTELINKTLGNKVWDITAMVREWVSSPSTNYGLLVNSDASKGADRYRFFASMEHPTANLRPYLSITYAAADTTAPVISGMAAGGVTSNGATITWTTNEAADTQVEYGTTTAYGTSTPIVSTLVTAHSQILTGLNPATTYQYRVKSRDAAGNLATSGNGTFTTAPLPDTTAPSVPQGLAASVLSAVQINLSWSASTDNVGVAGYRVYRNGVQVGTTTGRTYSDTGLLAATLYSYRVAAYDAAGNVSAQSAAVSATTLLLNQSATVNLAPAADTFISGNSTVYGAWETLNTYTWPANRVANAILMKFNLSGLPAGAVIQSATLNLSLVEADATADATYSIGVHKILNRNADLTRATGLTYDGVNGWTANSCCFNNVPLAQADISAAYDTRAVNKTLGPKSWNVAALVQEWVNSPASNYGLLLNSDATKGVDRYRFFASMEHPTASMRPSLSVTYTLP